MTCPWVETKNNKESCINIKMLPKINQVRINLKVVTSC